MIAHASPAGHHFHLLALMISLLFGSLLLEPVLDHAIVMLMIFPEGFLNGVLVSAFTVFCRDLVRTYDNVHYLGRPR